MKKTISILLTLVLMLSLSVTAFAASATTAPATDSADVNATYVEGGSGGVVFSVDIEWSAMDFTYQAAKWAQWDPETHSYSEPIPESWTGSGTVTITNHSNTALDVTPSYAMDSGYEATELKFTADGAAVTGAVIVESAADTGAAVEKTITVTPTGTLASGASGKIGTVTVTVDESEYVSLATAKALLNNMKELRYAREERYYKNGTEAEQYAFNCHETDLSMLQLMITDMEQGTGTQENLNRYYRDALEEYNKYMGSTTYGA